MKRFFRKALRGLAILLATLVVLLLAFYAEEDWRGARDWAACQRELAAKGETLDLRQLVPPGNPEDDLSKVPIFAEMYLAEQDYQKAKKPSEKQRINKIDINFKSTSSSLKPKTANYFKGESTDLGAWQKYYRSVPATHLSASMETPAQDVLQALSQFDPEMNEIEAAVKNPNAYWPINYDSPHQVYLGGITRMIRVAQVTQLSGIAHLENGEVDLAKKDYLFSIQVNQPLAKGCFVVNYLVMAANRTIADSILWEGLRLHAWNDAQLREMESALASTDILALGANSLRVDRASGLKTMAQAYANHALMRQAIERGEGMEMLYVTASIRPSGWWNQDQSFYCRRIQGCIEGIDVKEATLSSSAFPQHIETDWQRYEDIGFWEELYRPMSATALPTLDNMGPRIAKAETYRRLARLACRLEEYRIAHNHYPEKLDDLPGLPAHLNQEVLSEQPLHYQRKDDGYVLYSLGWNQKDDGGIYTHDAQMGDWPWPSP